MSITIKPDYTNHSDIEIHELYRMKTHEYNENATRQDMINELTKIWSLTKVEPEIECAICINPITNGNHLVLNCYHYYHTDCFLQYVNTCNNFKCPLCRKNQVETTAINTHNDINYHTHTRPFLIDTEIHLNEQSMIDEMFILGANNNIHRVYNSDNEDV